MVSVVIPVYNDGQMLRDALESILNQTYQNIEVIVVDSSDNESTINILKEYSSKIQILRQPKNGIAAALNVGMKQAKGEYIARMDADDISLPNRLELQVNYLQNHPEIDVLGTEADVINKEGEIIGSIESKCYTNSQIYSKFIFENCIIHPTVMMRSSLIGEGWMYDEKLYAEDLDLWMRLASNGKKFANLPEHLLKYRHYAGNASAAAEKVAPSAAKSAKKYVENLWGICDFEYESFTRPYYKFLIKKSRREFILEQLELLNEIYCANERRKIVDQTDLVSILNNRWRWVCLEAVGTFERLLEGTPNIETEKVFFVHKILEALKLDSIGKLKKYINETIEVEQQHLLLLEKDGAKYAIYGMGVRGKKLLTAIEQGKAKVPNNWELISLSDEKTIKVHYQGREWCTISQMELVKLKPDIIIVSSNKYFNEIKDELIERGVDEKKIVSSGILGM